MSGCPPCPGPPPPYSQPRSETWGFTEDSPHSWPTLTFPQSLRFCGEGEEASLAYSHARGWGSSGGRSGRPRGASPVSHPVLSPEAGDSEFRALLDIWFPEKKPLPTAFLVDTSEEALLLPDWLKLRMIRSEVPRLVDAGVTRTELGKAG